MSNKYEIILFRIILVLSSVDYWIMTSWNKKSFFVFSVTGVLAGIILCQLYSKSQQHISKINKTLSLITGLLFCYNLSISFYQTWITKQKVKMIAGLLSLDAVTFLKSLSYVMALIAFPFVVFGLSKIIGWLVYCWNLINKKKVWEMSVTFFSIKSLSSILINIVVASMVGTVLLVGAYSLPTEAIENHINSSSVIFEIEGAYPLLFPRCTSQLDNWTDAVMLLEAADDTADSAINKAMLAYCRRISDHNPSQSLVAHYINGIDFDVIRTYPRYWHGYHVLLKPLLEFMDYQSIRRSNAIVQLLLVVLTSCLLVWRKMKGYVIPFLLSYFMLMPVALAKSLQFSSCFYIFTLAMIAILLLKNKGEGRYEYFTFLNIGIATSYFDFLTYPIATFGVPAVLFLFMHSEYALERKLSSLLKSLFCWGVGYAGMWSLKWIIASLITGEDIIRNALNGFLARTSSSSADGNTYYTLLQCEIKNVRAFITTPFAILVVVFIILMIMRIL